MQRIAIARAVEPLVSRRCFSSAPRVMSEGDTGSGFSRSGGERSGDAFTRRERSAEEMWIKQEERAKLQQLKEKLEAHEKHVKELKKSIEELSKKESK